MVMDQSNVVKFSQFDKGMGKILNVW
jgi:hypothetical protein